MGPSHEAIEALLEVISPEKIDRCLEAFKTLGENGPLAVNIPARKALRIMSATEALGEIGPPAIAAVPALLVAYRKAIEAHHSMAVKTIPEALARIAPHSAAAKGAVAALIGALEPRHYGPERVGAIEALAHFGDEGALAIPKLRALKDDPEIRVRAVAGKTIAALEAKTKPPAATEVGRAKP